MEMEELAIYRQVIISQNIRKMLTLITRPLRLLANKQLLNTADLSGGRWGGGRYFQKNWVWVCGTLPETLSLFQTKICDFPYPISDLTLKTIPYFIPAL